MSTSCLSVRSFEPFVSDKDDDGSGAATGFEGPVCANAVHDKQVNKTVERRPITTPVKQFRDALGMFGLLMGSFPRLCDLLQDQRAAHAQEGQPH
jgi:hypothetical protein